MHEPKCPICHKKIAAPEQTESKYFPFCSRRCQLVDLGHWFRGNYTIPGETQQPSESQSEQEKP